MSGFSFTLPTGQPFEIKGPPGLTFEQAKQIFDKQAGTGALVGFKPGDALSAATQAAAGLASAQAQLGQALSGITGALGGGLSSSVGQIGSIVTGAAGAIGSIATQALSTITKSISGTAVTNGIDVADFSKQATALAPLGSLDIPQMTGVLAQAKNMVGQAFTAITNSKGVGQFGFDAKQLETAGILKPGISNLLAQGASTLTSVLKSPNVFTGAEGITSIENLLDSPATQDRIQQTLMAGGVAVLDSIGVPTAVLSASGLAGMALNAAKSVPNVESLIKGLPMPADIKADMIATIRDAAFAVDLTDGNIPDVFKELEIPIVAVGTVDRGTLDAAATRILGSDKIPVPSFGELPAAAAAASEQLTAAATQLVGNINIPSFNIPNINIPSFNIPGI